MCLILASAYADVKRAPARRLVVEPLITLLEPSFRRYESGGRSFSNLVLRAAPDDAADKPIQPVGVSGLIIYFRCRRDALLARRPKTAQRLALRSKIVLRAAEGLPNQVIARTLGVTGSTVGKWRERFRTHRLEGLSDEPRPAHHARSPTSKWRRR